MKGGRPKSVDPLRIDPRLYVESRLTHCDWWVLPAISDLC